MISNERPSPYGYRSPLPPRPPVQEETLHSGEVEIEDKSFLFMLKENPRGRFLRITEKSAGIFTSVIIPGPGLGAFKQRLDKMVKAASEPPAAAVSDLAVEHSVIADHLRVEHKSFEFALMENQRGQFLRILEKGRGRSNDIVIPASGLEAFTNLTDEMVRAAGEEAPTAAAGTETHILTPPGEETLKTGQMQLERRVVTFTLKNNPRGRFLRITTEEIEGRYNSLIIPAEGLEEFAKWVVEMAEAAKQQPE